jgi:hypothetical protein
VIVKVNNELDALDTISSLEKYGFNLFDNHLAFAMRFTNTIMKKPTRAELHYKWVQRNDKCKICENAFECKLYKNGTQECVFFKEMIEK